MLNIPVTFRAFIPLAILVSFVTFQSQAKTLDDFVEEVRLDQAHNPFLLGEAGANKQPVWPELKEFANSFNTEIEWNHSVATAVLKLPPNPNRMKIKPTLALDGWFDEYTSPNLIILDTKSAFITVLHELRHAVQLGSHGLIAGTEFDRLLQQNKHRIKRFQENLAASPLSDKDKIRLKNASTRLVETCSEVSAHNGDVILSRAFGHEDYAKSYLGFIQGFKREFLKDHQILKNASFSKNESFVDDLYDGLYQLMTEKGFSTTGF